MGDERVAAVAGPDVSLRGERLAAALADPSGDLGRRLRAGAVGQQDGGAGPGEGLGDGGADTAARAGDHRSRAVEPLHPARRGYAGADGGQADEGADELAAAAQLACVLEVSAEKPGNITPTHDFGDTSFEDMVRSAIALGPEIGRAGERGVGETVLASVRATRRVAGANTNLGIALLLAPLARAGAAREASARSSPRSASTTRAPRTRRSAWPARAGFDEPVEHDVRDEPEVTLARGDGGGRRGATRSPPSTPATSP